jgi:hypothetical protein
LVRQNTNSIVVQARVDLVMLGFLPDAMRLAIGVIAGVVVSGIVCIVIFSRVTSRNDGREGFAALIGPSYNVAAVREKRLSMAMEHQRRQADRAKARMRRTSAAIGKSHVLHY